MMVNNNVELNQKEFLNNLFEEFKNNNINIIPEKDITMLSGHVGEGTFGMVYKGFYDKKLIAIKQLKFLDDINVSGIMNEIKSVEKVKISNIPTFYGVWFSNNYLHLIFDFIEGDVLSKFIDTYNFNEKLDVSIQLTEIIAKLHEDYLIHRDLKPGNIMIMKGKVHVIDFGVSKIASHTITKTKNQSGSVPYMAPENFDINDEITSDDVIAISTKFDIWSLGCILSYLFSGEKPWGDNSEQKIITKLSTKKNFHVPSKIDSSLRNIIKMCFVIDPKDRISAKDLLIELKKLAEGQISNV